MRGFLVALVGALCMLCALAAHAQAVPDERPAQLLGCLAKRASPPRFPQESLGDTRAVSTWMRVKLSFERPDAPPRVDVLANTATEAMQDEVLGYLKSYRLPCLTASDGTVVAVQEVQFTREFVTPSDAPPKVEVSPLLPLPAVTEAPCIVMPRHQVGYDTQGMTNLTDNLVTKTLVRLRFAGDGEQPPEVEVLYTNAGTRSVALIQEYARQYRAPCRTADTRPYVVEQMFAVTSRGAKPSSFRYPVVSLEKFLRSVSDGKSLQASFDFDTMACPFRVTWTLRRPHLPNVARVKGAVDPNRLEFLRWLASLDLTLDERAAERLFDESMGIDVPCGKFALKPAG